MKKGNRILLSVVLIMIAVVCLVIIWKQKVKSTDLSNVQLDHIVLGETYKKENFSEYTPSDYLKGKKNQVSFKELQLKLNDNNEIIQVKGNKGEVVIHINGTDNPEKIEDVIVILGDYYSSGWYDWNQRLKYIKYVDRDNKEKATFVYSEHDKNLVWILLDQY